MTLQLRDDCLKKADRCPSFPSIYETPFVHSRKTALLDDFFLADPEVIYRVNRTIRSVEKVRESYNNGISGDSQVAGGVEPDINAQIYNEAATRQLHSDDDRFDIDNIHALLNSEDEETTIASHHGKRGAKKARPRRIGDRRSSTNNQGNQEEFFTMDDMRLSTNKNIHGAEELKISGAGNVFF